MLIFHPLQNGFYLIKIGSLIIKLSNNLVGDEIFIVKFYGILLNNPSEFGKSQHIFINAKYLGKKHICDFEI